jgi:hypothetical protein
MSTRIDPPDDERDPLTREEPLPETGLSVDGVYSDNLVDPAMAPVIEAGGGVAEGFEQAEALLVDHATREGLDATTHILRDAGAVEEEPDRGIYGEADHERSSERQTD